MDKDKAIRSAKLTAAGLLDKARARTAVTRAGGQIAPSKYLPNIPRAVHADGGSVTDTDEFRNWFGNSATHTDGEPHVLYTGTSKDKDFTSFNVGRHGAWFTRDPALASQYAEQNDSQGYKMDGWKLTPTNTASRVIPAYVKAENPYTGDLPDEVLRSNYKAAQSDWFDTLRRKGHDAWIPARHNGDLVVALKEPQQIKSIFNNGKFDPNQKHMNKAGGGRIHAEDGGKMELRSRAAEAIRNQPQLKGNVNQLLAVAAKGKGVKQAELANAGRPTGNIVSKEELAKHFEDAVPKVQVKELKNKEPKPLSSSEMAEYRRLEADPFGYGQDGYDRLQELEDRQHGEIKARYQQYTLPQGENYREHLLHLPAEHGPDSWTNFRSSHWETPNVIAHLRMKDRDNGKTLHVEEVQSDWGQEGRERGFYDIAKPFHVFDAKTGQTVHEASTADEAEAVADKLGPQYDYQSQHDDMPPKGPYVGNTQQWTDLAIKHALTEAAKGGHDRVVFSPGQANADMYGQRNPITEADLVSDPNYPDILGHLHTYDSASRKQNAPIQVENETHLAKILGKEHARDILAEPLSNLSSSGMKSQFISGPNMAIGGHGMVDYYNNIVHPSALKLLQQHDPSIKPESYDLPNGYKGFSLPMTDTARQSILKNGFGAFKRGGTVGKEEGGATGSLREKALWPSAQAIKAGTGSREAHAELVNKIKPVSPYAAPVSPASDEQVHDALTKDKQPKAFAPRGLEEGTPVAVRLDIPAYEKKNTWVVSVHHPKTDFTAGEVIGYDSVAHIGNPRFGVHPTGALNIASGKPKSTIATVHGNWKKTTPEDAFALSQTIHNDPQWRQVGMDPERHSYFYDRETQEPVMAADEALHIGPLVYAKNPVYGKKTDFAFSKGGDVSAAIALTRRFTKDGAGATMALKPKGK